MNKFIETKYHEKLNINITIPSINYNDRLPVVVMTHGFGSSGLNLTNTALSEKLNLKGIATIACDLSGHGNSEGKIEEQTVTKAKNEIEAVIEYVYNFDWVDRRKIILLANSFSGNSALLYASETNKIMALVMKSPITDYKDVRDRQLGKQLIKKWMKDGIIEIDNKNKSRYEFYKDICSIDTYEAIKNIKCPIFIVQGDEDELISKDNIKKLKETLDNKKDMLKIIRGANHKFDKKEHFDESINLMYSFILKICKIN